MIEIYNTLPLSHRVLLPIRVTKALHWEEAPTVELCAGFYEDKYRTRGLVIDEIRQRNAAIREYHRSHGVDYSTKKLEKPLSKTHKLFRRCRQWLAERF